jgi:hypothetical protein
MQSTEGTMPITASSGRLLGECEVCEETRMMRTETFRHGGVRKKVRVCRSCAEGGREIEADEAR